MDEETDDEVTILESRTTGEVHLPPRTEPGALHHTRSTPLPQRCRSGSFEPDALVLEGVRIPWGDVEMIAVGQIHHSLGDMEGPKTMMRQMFGKVMGKDEKADKKQPRYQEFVFLDVLAAGHDSPFRLEAANINYRQFLEGDVAFISWHNFYRLVVRLTRQATEAWLTESSVAFLQRRRDQMKRYGAVYDFEMDNFQARSRLETLTPVAEVDLGRDSWAAEWDETED